MSDDHDHPAPAPAPAPAAVPVPGHRLGFDDSLDPVQVIFLRARELPADERRTWLETACPTPEGRREVLELLAAEAASEEDTFAAMVERGIADLREEIGGEAGPASGAPTTAGDLEPLEGRTIGRYHLGRRLGEGGFAVVHEAEQREPVRRTVAVKILKPGMDSVAVLARFDAERQALAMMQHPGIAGVLDGGVTDRGRPYFVMERVDGIPIARFADEQALPVRSRLELFARVCDAVQHAHQKGVVHRDLKPGNILVEPGDGPGHPPRPRVIDFGIAKALAGPLIDEPAATRAGQMIGTPGYMSPEQVLGDPGGVDTRADVHALGVILHELLTGGLPVAYPAGESPAAIARRLETAVPRRPSDRLAAMDAGDARVVARRRATTPTDLRRRLRRDLDWICLRAIDRDPDRRYASVSELSADVRRSLAGDLIDAGPPTVGYRLRTFVRRRRLEVLSGSVVVAALLIGGAVSTLMAVDAARARDQQAAVSSFLERFILTASPFDAFTETGAGAGPSDASADGDSRSSILRSRLEEASGLVSEELAAWPAAQAQVRLTLARALHGLGATAQSATEARAAMILAAAHVGSESRLVFEAMALLGRAEWQMTNPDETIALLEPGLGRAERALGPEDPETLRLANNLALAYRAVGRDADARSLHEQTLRRRERALGTDHPDTVISRSNYARALQAAGDLAGALDLQRAVLAAHEEQLGPGHPETLITADQLGTLLGDLGRLEEAADLHRRAHAGLSVVLGPAHESTLGARFYLAGALGRLGQLAEAERELRAIHETCREQFGPDDRYTTTSLISLADVVRRQGRAAEAVQLLEPTLARAAAADGGWTRPQTWGLARTEAVARQDAGDHEAALALLDRVIDEAGRRLAPDDLRFVELLMHRAVSQAALGEHATARPVLERGTQRLLTAGKRSSPALERGLPVLAGILDAAGESAAASDVRATAASLAAGGAGSSPD